MINTLIPRIETVYNNLKHCEPRDSPGTNQQQVQGADAETTRSKSEGDSQQQITQAIMAVEAIVSATSQPAKVSDAGKDTSRCLGPLSEAKVTKSSASGIDHGHKLPRDRKRKQAKLKAALLAQPLPGSPPPPPPMPRPSMPPSMPPPPRPGPAIPVPVPITDLSGEVQGYIGVQEPPHTTSANPACPLPALNADNKPKVVLLPPTSMSSDGKMVPLPSPNKALGEPSGEPSGLCILGNFALANYAAFGGNHHHPVPGLFNFQAMNFSSMTDEPDMVGGRLVTPPMMTPPHMSPSHSVDSSSTSQESWDPAERLFPEQGSEPVDSDMGLNGYSH